MTVAVVIPTHNRASKVLVAIRSVLSQTVMPAEIIVVDDASSDGTAELVEAHFGERVKIVRLEKNVGGATARNVGIDSVSTPYIAFLDSDDEWLPEKLASQMSMASSDSDAVQARSLYYTAGYLGHRAGEFSPTRAIRNGEAVSDYLLVSGQEIQTSGWLLRTKLAKSIRFTDGLRRHQDLDFLLRGASQGMQLQFFNEPTYRRGWEKGGLSVGQLRNDGVSSQWLESIHTHMSDRARERFWTVAVFPYELKEPSSIRRAFQNVTMGLVPASVAARAVFKQWLGR